MLRGRGIVVDVSDVAVHEVAGCAFGGGVVVDVEVAHDLHFSSDEGVEYCELVCVGFDGV